MVALSRQPDVFLYTAGRVTLPDKRTELKFGTNMPTLTDATHVIKRLGDRIWFVKHSCKWQRPSFTVLVSFFASLRVLLFEPG